MAEVDASLASVTLPSEGWWLTPDDTEITSVVATRDSEWSVRPQLRVEVRLVEGPPDPDAVAASLIEALDAAGDRVVVEHRDRLGSDGAPVVIQLVRADTIVDGRFEALRCAHAVIGMTDRHAAERGVVYVLTMTADARELPDLIGDFQEVVGSLQAVDPQDTTS